MTDDLDQQVADLVAGVADRLAFHLVEPIKALVDELVRDRLGSLLEQLGGAKPPPLSKRSRRSVKAPKASKPANVNKAAGPSCGKCGKRGHNARTCGKASVASDDDDEDEEEGVADLPARAPTATSKETVQTASNRRKAVVDLRAAHHPEPDDDEDTEPEIRTPWKPADPVVRGPSCPHGNGSPASCSQCHGATVKHVAIVAGSVVVDGATLRSTRDQEVLGRAKHGRQYKKKAAA